MLLLILGSYKQKIIIKNKKTKKSKNQKILKENKINILVRRVYKTLRKFSKIGRGRSNIQD